MLKLKNVCAGYGNTDILHNISFNIEPGRNLAIIGANGSGKSTLLKVMAGLLPYRGNISLCGQELRATSRKNISQKIAMLGQMPHIYFPYTVYDTVMMGRFSHTRNSLFGAATSQDKEAVTQCLKDVGMLHAKDYDISRLSGGQLQRVLLARTLVQDPSIILLDEPTNHLDLKYQAELIDHIVAFAKENGRIIVGVLHDLNHAMRLGGDILALSEGREVAFGENILTRELLQDVFDTDVVFHMQRNMANWHNF